MSRRGTALQIAERETEVYQLVIRGATRGEILRHGSEKWQLTERQTEEYLARATARFKALAAFVREEEFGKTRARLEDLYARNVKVQDFKAAHAVLSDAAELLGLYPPKTTKQEHSGAVAFTHARIDDDRELLSRLREELARGDATAALPAPRLEPSSADRPDEGSGADARPLAAGPSPQ